jgi:raffinose/stachyose/melibiose transport system permease protein
MKTLSLKRSTDPTWREGRIRSRSAQPDVTCSGPVISARASASERRDHGFVKAIPRAMEESAQMDGCNQLETFVRVVFPLLIPVTMTIAILDSLWIWNDFLLPLVIINKYNNYTLVLAASIFFGQYTTEWSSILSILMLTSIPVILLYLLFQSYIVRGIAEGAIKG